MSLADYRNLPTSDWNRIEQIVRRFEDGWRSEAELPPEIEDALEDAGSLRAHLLMELVHADLEFRIRAGQPVRVEEYINRFPELAEQPDALCDLINTERRCRTNAGEDVLTDEYCSRFPELADRLREGSGGGEENLLRLQPARSDDATLDHARPVSWPLATATACLERLEQLWPRGGDDGKPEGESTLGDFRLIREVGRGGMGVVFEAEQLSLSRRVALKVLPFASMLDDRKIQRFKNESLAAARLDHPHIVHVHGIGCEHGVHYYAMQFIEGHTLAEAIAAMRKTQVQKAPQMRVSKTPHHDEQERAKAGFSDPDPHIATVNDVKEPPPDSQGPSTDNGPQTTDESTSLVALLSTDHSANGRAYFQRIVKIGIQIVDALDYAHSVGVVHRDIKPSNLLLDHSGKVYVADFGLAQFESDANLSMTGDVLGTLRYMSPEQALGQRGVVDQRSDVYSLAVTLYELLTLEPAVRGTERGEILQALQNDDFRPLRSINRAIPKDLETIVLKAIAREPLERYATAQQLADDLRRFLEDIPIVAKPPTVLQRAFKWARRHRAWVSASFVLLLILAIVGPATAINQLSLKRAADTERERAEVNFQRTLEAVDELLTEVSENDLLNTPGMETVRRSLLEKAMAFYGDLLRENVSSKTLRRETAHASGRIAQIQNLLGEWDESEVAHRRAIALFKQLIAESPDPEEEQLALATNYIDLGFLYSLQGRLEEGAAAYRQGLLVVRALLTKDPENRGYLRQLAHTQDLLGASCYVPLKKYAEAEKVIREALSIKENLAANPPDDPDAQMMLGIGYQDLGQLLEITGHDAEAEEYFRKAVQVKERSVGIGLNIATRGERATNVRRRQLSYTYGGLARHLTKKGNLPEAEAFFRKAVVQDKILIQNFPYVLVYANQYVAYSEQLALQLFDANRIADSEHTFREAISAFEEFPHTANRRFNLGKLHRAFAGFLYHVDRDKEAIDAYRKSIELLEQLCASDDVEEGAPHELGRACNNLAWLLVVSPALEFRDATRAVKLASKAVEIGMQIEQIEQISQHYNNTLGVAQYRAGDFNAAIEALNKSIVRTKSGAFDYFFLAMAHWQLGKQDEARTWYDKAVDWMEANLPKDEILIRFRSEAEILLDIPTVVPRPESNEET